MTAGSAGDPAGLTVSSLTLADGDPWQVLAVVSDTSDFFDVVEETGAFVVHCLEASQRGLADRVAGIAPAPGGMFRDATLVDTPWGPRVEGLDSWLGATRATSAPIGHQHLVVGEVEHITVHDLADPLVYFRGRYRALRQP